jgi:hypothetical protein
VNGELIKAKAEVFAERLGIAEKCKWSDGWLAKFKSRAGLKYFTLHGEAADADIPAAYDYAKIDIPKIVRDNSEDDIFNADETGLFWRCLPSKTYDLATKMRGETMKGSKKLKERVTFLAMINASGTEKYGLVIGTAKSPLSFRNKVFPPSLMYDSSKNGWMTAFVWTKFFDYLNIQLRRANRHILVLVDNFAGHVVSDWSNITMKFLPPNTTSIIQPCDQGVINSFKSQYRKRMLRRVVETIEEANTQITATEICKKINLFDACKMIHESWDSISTSCIQNCWRKGGFDVGREKEASPEAQKQFELDMQEVTVLLENLGMDSSIAQSEAQSLLENGIEGENLISDVGDSLEETILSEVIRKDSVEEISGDVDPNDPDDPEDILIPVSATAALSALSVVNQFYSENGYDANFENARKIIRHHLVQSRTQSRVSDFFKPLLHDE